MSKNDAKVNIAEAAARLGVSARHVRRLCRAGKLARAVKAGRDWDIPVTADPRLAAHSAGSGQARSADLKDVPPAKLEAALHKRGLLEQCEAFCNACVKEGMQRSEGLAIFAHRSGVPVRTLRRWSRRLRDHGLAGLIDRRGRGDALGPVISAEAWNEFLSMYLDARQPTVKACWLNIGFINRQQNKGWTIPSLRTLQQYVTAHIPQPVLVLHREGLGAYQAKCAPYIETDLEGVEPGAVWIGDHHQCDFWVLHRGQWPRPWLTVWEDMRSRAIVGWKVTDSPNQTTIMQAFRAGAETYGPPEAVKIDNGKDYDSEMWTGTTKVRRRLAQKLKLDEPLVAGLYAMMAVSVSFAIPYHAQAKAVERWFDTFERQFGKTMPTYCGPDTARRPEALADYLKTQRAADEAMELAEFAEQFGRYVAVYNQSAHSGRGMEGRTPMQVMRRRRSRRVMDEGVLDLLLRNWTGELTVGKNGVRVKGLMYGRYDTALLMHQGRKVRCSYDPEDMSQVSVFDAASYRLLTIAEQSDLVGYGTAASEADLRAAMRQKTKARKAVRDAKPAARVSHMKLTDLTLAALQERTRSDDAPDAAASIKPVRTVMDQNIKLHRRLATQKKVRRAAGAEGTTHVVELTLDDAPDRREPDGPTLSLDFGGKQKKRAGPTLTLLDG